MAALASDWLSHLRLLLWNRITEFNETWQEARSQHPLQSLCFSGRSEKQDGRTDLWSSETLFDFSSETAEWKSMKLDRKQDLNVLYRVCVFRADRKNKMAALASDWLRHVRLLLWNRRTACNETWQEEISQRPIPSLCFGLIGKIRWPPWPIGEIGGTLYSGARYVALWDSCFDALFPSSSPYIFFSDILFCSFIIPMCSSPALYWRRN